MENIWRCLTSSSVYKVKHREIEYSIKKGKSLKKAGTKIFCMDFEISARYRLDLNHAIFFATIFFQ